MGTHRRQTKEAFRVGRVVIMGIDLIYFDKFPANSKSKEKWGLLSEVVQSPDGVRGWSTECQGVN